jgi:hypothetical protein
MAFWIFLKKSNANIKDNGVAPEMALKEIITSAQHASQLYAAWGLDCGWHPVSPHPRPRAISGARSVYRRSPRRGAALHGVFGEIAVRDKAARLECSSLRPIH